MRDVKKPLGCFYMLRRERRWQHEMLKPLAFTAPSYGVVARLFDQRVDTFCHSRARRKSRGIVEADENEGGRCGAPAKAVPMHEYEAISDEVICAFGAAAGEDSVLLAEPMREHTTFKIGGPADAVVSPRTPEAAARTLDVCAIAGVPTTVVGNGSDLLVGDRGIRGIVVLLRENMSEVRVEGTRVHAQAGALLRDVALAAADAGLSGLEPLWGIPAAVGGACHQNAGAYDACIADVLESLTAYVPGAVLPDGTRAKGTVRTFTCDELGFGYRKSRVASDGLVVLEATFALTPDMEASIRGRMDDYQQRREEKQPLELPSAGSTFKRPPGYFAGKLIMDAGLRGYRVGGAQVSEKHCGFVVNTGEATAADVNALIEHVQDEVRTQFGVELEPEVHRIGEF